MSWGNYTAERFSWVARVLQFNKTCAPFRFSLKACFKYFYRYSYAVYAPQGKPHAERRVE